jgi:hypothetical protein
MFCLHYSPQVLNRRHSYCIKVRFSEEELNIKLFTYKEILFSENNLILIDNNGYLIRKTRLILYFILVPLSVLFCGMDIILPCPWRSNQLASLNSTVADVIRIQESRTIPYKLICSELSASECDKVNYFIVFHAISLDCIEVVFRVRVRSFFLYLHNVNNHRIGTLLAIIVLHTVLRVRIYKRTVGKRGPHLLIFAREQQRVWRTQTLSCGPLY